MDLETGATLGSYQITRRLGRGAAGVVYQARHPEFGDVALKLLLADLVSDEGARVRFVREADTLVRLRHRNIVTVFESGVSEDTPYLAMELLTGTTLAETLASGTPMTLERKLDIVIQLCDGLQFVHERGIIHRDVKPANVWLTSNAGVKLLDFGIAHTLGSTFTRAGDVVGSAAYMAPEQVAGGEIDGRADIFAAGVVLYELLAGSRPFEAENVSAVLHKILHEPAAPLASHVSGLSPDIVTAVETALEKDVAARYGQVEDFGSDLRLARYTVQQEPERTMVVTKPSAPPADTASTLLAPTRSTGHSHHGSDPAPHGAAAHPSPDSAGAASVMPGVPAQRPIPAPTATTDSSPAAMPAAAPRATTKIAVAVAAAAAVVIAVLLRWQPWAGPEFTLDVRSTPSGALIAVDGAPLQNQTPAIVSLAEKPARVRLTLPGYEPVEREVGDLSPAEPLVLSVTFRRIVRVESEPSGATIRVDGRDTGLSTPADVPMDAGALPSLQLSSGGGLRGELRMTDEILKSGTVKVALTAGETAAPVRRAAGENSAAGSPVGGATRGTTPVTVHVTGSYPFEITGCGQSSPAASVHELEVTAPCQLRLRAPKYYLDEVRTVGASAGRIDMAAPQLARVQLRSKLEVCTIVLNDQAVGSPPVDLELVAGTYRVAIQCPDRTYAIRALAIEPGQSTRRLDDLLP